jgi:hypothetical protein
MGPQGHGCAPEPRIRSSVHLMLRRSDFLSGESGQTFVEWLGAMAFVVVLVGLVIAAVPGVGHTIVDTLDKIINAIGV